MDAEKTEALLKSWPAWFEDNFYFECGDGWFQLIWDLCKDLEEVVPRTFKVVQVKEKFGGLRFYVEGYLGQSQNEGIILDRISWAERESCDICEECGRPGTMSRKNWWKVRCEEHK